MDNLVPHAMPFEGNKIYLNRITGTAGVLCCMFLDGESYTTALGRGRDGELQAATKSHRQTSPPRILHFYCREGPYGG